MSVPPGVGARYKPAVLKPGKILGIVQQKPFSVRDAFLRPDHPRHPLVLRVQIGFLRVPLQTAGFRGGSVVALPNLGLRLIAAYIHIISQVKITRVYFFLYLYFGVALRN